MQNVGAGAEENQRYDQRDKLEARHERRKSNVVVRLFDI